MEKLCADRLCRRELADQGVIPLILSLLQSNVAPLNSATALANLSLTDELKPVIRREGLNILLEAIKQPEVDL